MTARDHYTDNFACSINFSEPEEMETLNLISAARVHFSPPTSVYIISGSFKKTQFLIQHN